MVINWMGHSCFKVTISDGTRILFDPYDNAVGYPPQNLEADIAVISHDHFDHNAVNRINGKFKTVRDEGLHNINNTQIEGIKIWHDASGGNERGENLVFLLRADGLVLCHMGDIGCMPSEELYQKLSGVDILMIPVGGNFTIDAQQALEICARIDPNIIIPMHFKTQFVSMNIANVDDFLKAAGNDYDISYPGQCYLEIDKTRLKKRTRIVVMECI